MSLTLKHGKLLLLAYDETDGGYYQIESDRTIAVKKFEIVYGSAPDYIFSTYKEQGIKVYQFDSSFATSHKEVV